MDTNFRDEYRHRQIKILELQRRLERENAVMLYGALAKHAPAALEELRGKLHQNTNEPDKLAIQYPEVFGIFAIKPLAAGQKVIINHDAFEGDCFPPRLAKWNGSTGVLKRQDKLGYWEVVNEQDTDWVMLLPEQFTAFETE